MSVKEEMKDFTPNVGLGAIHYSYNFIIIKNLDYNKSVLELWSNGFRITIFDRPLLLPNIPALQHSIPPQTLATKGTMILPPPSVE